MADRQSVLRVSSLATETSPPAQAAPRSPWVRAGIVAGVLFALGLAIFSPFVFGDQILLYKGIGSDSINEDFPNAVHLSHYVRTTGVPLWSFHLGMGQTLYPFASLLLLNPVSWLPKEVIAEALVWQHLLKAMLAGLLFYRFLELRGLNFRSATAGAALLAYSTYMCFGACWSIAANEVLGFSLLLFAIEMRLSQGRWIYLPLAVAFLGLVNVFHLYLGALLLCLYVPARVIALFGWQPRLLWRICLPMAGVATLGCGLAALVAIDSAAAIFNSPRVIDSGDASLASKPIFSFESSRHYITAIFRRFSADMLGTGLEFRGWYNYFEAPANYCGLVSLILLPQAFVQATRRQRLLYALFLGYLSVPVIFPWFRHLFWAFQGDYYRVYSLFGVFGVIALAMHAFSGFVERRIFNPWLLGATLLVLLAVLWLPVHEVRSLIVPELQRTITIILVLQAGLLAAGHFWRRQALCSWLVLGVSAITLIHLDQITVADRDTVLKSELAQRTGYNDHTVEAVRDIKTADEGFYRVSKLYSSGPAIHASLNDAMVFGYFGTSSYSSFNDLDYISFLTAIDVVPKNATEFDTRWAKGLSERPLVAGFANEKYVLTKEPQPLRGDAGYEFVRSHGDVHTFRARNFVPFGLALPRYISVRDFLQWPPSAKEHALYYAAVLPDHDPETRGAIERLTLPKLDLDAFTQLFQREPLDDTRAALGQHGLNLQSFSNNAIEGTLQLDRDAIVVFQTAFDPGWKAHVDGARAPVLRVDAGLVGVPVTAGEHTLRLRFLPRFLPLGAGVALLSALALLLIWRRWPRFITPGSLMPLPTATATACPRPGEFVT